MTQSIQRHLFLTTVNSATAAARGRWFGRQR